jgi:ribonuclease P protein component
MPSVERFTFPRRMRLRRRGDFERLLREGQRAGDDHLQVWVLPNGLEHSRFGLMVGRRHGGAVRRNRIKRVLREAFRLSRAQLPRGLDIACAPRVGARIELQPVANSLTRLLERAARRLGRR